MSTREELLIEIKGQNEASPALKQVQADVKGLGGAVGRANDILGQLGLGFSAAAVVAGIGAIGAASLQLAADAEQTKIAFTNMLGSAEAADEFLGELRAFAAQTPFEFTELTDAARRMKALGFAAEDVIPLLTNIGDAVAAMGGNAAMVDRVTLALGQMLSKGKVQAGEMLQLTEAGIPAWRYLAESIGVTTAEVQKMSEKGLIPAEKAIAAIQAGMQEDFGGMMAQQATTAAGRMSNLTDKLELLGTTLGNITLPMQNFVVDGLGRAADAAQVLLTGSDQIVAAYGEQAVAVEQSSSSYRQYVEQVALLDDTTRQYYLALLDTNGGLSDTGYSADYLAGEYGILSEAEWEAMKATEAEADAQRALSAETDRWTGLADSYIQAQRDATSAVVDSKTAMDLLKESMGGAVGKENKEFAESQTTLEEKAAKLREELGKLTAVEGQTYGPTADLAGIQNDLALAQITSQEAAEKLAKAQKELSDNTDPEKQRDLQKAVLQAQSAYDGSLGKVDEYTQKLGDADGGVISHKTKIDELSQKLADAEAAIEENAAKHEEATKRILFGYLLQEAAVDGFSKNEQIALTLVAGQWGLLDDATTGAQMSMIGAVKKLNDDDNIEGFMSTVNAAKDAALGLGDSIDEIPKETNVAINVHTTYTSSGGTGAGGPGIGGGGPIALGGAGPLGGAGALVAPPSVPFTQTASQMPQGGAAGIMAALGGGMPMQVYIIQDQLAAALLVANQRDMLAQYADSLMA